MSNYSFNDIPNFFQDSTMQKMLEYQNKLNSMIPQVSPALLGQTEMMSKMQKNMSMGLSELFPALEWANKNQALIQSIDYMATQIQSLIPMEFATLNDTSWLQPLTGVLSNYKLTHIYSDDIPEEECKEIEETNNKIVTEIFLPDSEKKIIKEDSPIIVLSPINDKVLRYLSEHPEEMYNLTPGDFETFMAELYSKLGYSVTRTQATRDGGKDIIIRKPEFLGDFIYYVECKKYASDKHIGVGIVRELVCTVNTDKVNGGILATTSFFTRDARKFILENSLQYQIKMQDYNSIKEMLDEVV